MAFLKTGKTGNRILAAIMALSLLPTPSHAENNTALGLAIGALIGAAVLGIASSSKPEPPPQPEPMPPPVRRLSLRELAEYGNADAQLKLGNSAAARKNYPEALKWYQKAADNNNGEAQFKLGTMYSNGVGVLADEQTGMWWYRQAAFNKYAPAIDVIREAANKGSAPAETALGYLYQSGSGMPQDDIQAVKWYRLAAEQGNSDGQTLLGGMYASGKGVPQDYQEAFKWHKFGALQGNPFAEASLAELYKNGTGTYEDKAEAYKWLSLSASQQNPAAKQALAELESRLTAAEIAAAQKEAREFVPGKRLTKAEMNEIVVIDTLKRWAMEYYLYGIGGFVALIMAIFLVVAARRPRSQKAAAAAMPSFEVVSLEDARKAPSEKTVQEKLCISCHAAIRAKAEMCPKCGTMQKDSLLKRTAS